MDDNNKFKSPAFWGLVLAVAAVIVVSALVIMNRKPSSPKPSAEEASTAKLAQPSYNGKTLAAWVLDLASKEKEVRDPARGAVRSIGPAGIPVLIKIMEDTTYSENQRGGAAIALSYVGKNDGPEVQALIGQLKDAKNLVRASALTTLGTLKLDAVILIPICVRMLEDPNNGVRRRAAVNLGDLGKAAAEAIPALQKAATDENEAARLAAVDALARINREPGVSSKKSLSQLLKDLSSKKEQTQFDARSALRRMGQEVVPELIRTLEDPARDPNARGDAAQGLGFAGKNGGPEVKVLLDALKDQQNYVRANALSSLGVLHIEAKTLIPICIEMLGDKNNGVRRRAAMNLGGYGAAAAEAVPALKTAASDSDQSARVAAVWALSQIERSAQ